MSLLDLTSIKQIPTEADHVLAFEVTGYVKDADADAMAKYMDAVFDEKDDLNLLLHLHNFTGSQSEALFNGQVINSNWQSLFKVKKYAVIGAPEAAMELIKYMNKLLPVEARAFAQNEEHMAWKFVGARAL